MFLRLLDQLSIQACSHIPDRLTELCLDHFCAECQSLSQWTKHILEFTKELQPSNLNSLPLYGTLTFRLALSVIRLITLCRITNRIASYFSTVTFDEYLSYRISPKGKFDRVFLKLPAQNAFLCKNNRVIVDRVFKFENISNLESDLCNRFPGLEINLPRVNVTRSKRDRAVNEYFQNRKTLDKFMHLYEKDFELFDYSTAI